MFYMHFPKDRVRLYEFGVVCMRAHMFQSNRTRLLAHAMHRLRKITNTWWEEIKMLNTSYIYSPDKIIEFINLVVKYLITK